MVFKHLNIQTQANNFISYFAKEYLKQRKGKNDGLQNNPVFKNSGFDLALLEKIIAKSSVKENLNIDQNGKLNPKDLYRSELGEMLMTSYFEKHETLSINERFVIPLKLITDKENSDMPSRGIDCIGFRKESDKIHLLVGECKVSDEKESPPQVVKQIYDTQLELTKNDILIKKLADFSKKLDREHYELIIYLIALLDCSKTENYSITYGCTLVRDKYCINVDKDFGKMKTKQADFEPNNIHFVILWFEDQTIEDTVKQFYAEVQKQVS